MILKKQVLEILDREYCQCGGFDDHLENDHWMDPDNIYCRLCNKICNEIINWGIVRVVHKISKLSKIKQIIGIIRMKDD